MNPVRKNSCCTIIAAILIALAFGCSKSVDQPQPAIAPASGTDQSTPSAAPSSEASPLSGNLDLQADTSHMDEVSSDTATNADSSSFDSSFGIQYKTQTGFKPQTATPTGDVIDRRPDGSVYEGHVLDGVLDGEGTFSQPNGTIMHGEWRAGKMYKISGTSIFPDGTKEVGNWNVDGSPSGGTITWPDGRQYKGPWKILEGETDLPEGSGEMTWPDGRKYIGQFHDGQMDGPGKMAFPDGKVQDGIWKAGQFTGPTGP